MFEFDQYLGFILFLTVLTMGFWLLILLLTFIVPYWVSGAIIERIKELRKKPVKEDWEFDPNTLLQQLGGNKFMVMTGAKNLMVDKKEKSLHMRIGKNSKGINHVKITYMPDDTYKMDFGRIRKMDYKVVRSVTGVYADALQDVFTEVTGMYTSL